MCILIRKTRKKSVTGYKIALKIKGRYYSPAAGIEYKVGPVKGVTKAGKNALEEWSWVFNPAEGFYSSRYFGKTAVYLSPERLKANIKESWHRYGACLLKMTISGDIWETDYSLGKTFAGDHIDKMEEVL